MRGSNIEKFIAKSDKNCCTPCWRWIGRLDDDGYGRIQIKKKHIRSNRFAYETIIGPIPDGLVVMHSCDHPWCVNPAHLSLGTVRNNNEDRAKKHRSNPRRGENSPVAKLSESDVLDIFNSNEPLLVLAHKYGVNFRTISSIRTGVNWKFLTSKIQGVFNGSKAG